MLANTQRLARWITIVAMYGAIILPILAEMLPRPTPTFLTTVGKTSLLYKYTVGKLIAIPTRPSEAKNTRAVALLTRVIKSKLTPDSTLPPIRIFRRDTRDIKYKTIMVPGISMAAASGTRVRCFISRLRNRTVSNVDSITENFYPIVPEIATLMNISPSMWPIYCANPKKQLPHMNQLIPMHTVFILKFGVRNKWVILYFSLLFDSRAAAWFS